MWACCRFMKAPTLHPQEGSLALRSPFSSPAAQSPYPSPSHPFGPRAPTRRRPACEDVLFFDIPVSEVGLCGNLHEHPKSCWPQVCVG